MKDNELKNTIYLYWVFLMLAPISIAVLISVAAGFLFLMSTAIFLCFAFYAIEKNEEKE